jgi:hypothetical protein
MQFLDCPPERRAMWRLLLAGRAGGAAPDALQEGPPGAALDGGRRLPPLARVLASRLDAAAAASAAASADPQAKAAAAAVFRRLLRAVEKRHKAMARDAAGHEVRGAAVIL